MLVLLLRTLNYIFPYFFSLNNECASECVHHSFSAWQFLSVVDRRLGSRVNVSASPSCLPQQSTNTLTLCHSILPSIWQWSSATPIECIRHPQQPQQWHGHHQATATSPRHKDNDATHQWSPPNGLRYLTVMMHNVVTVSSRSHPCQPRWATSPLSFQIRNHTTSPLYPAIIIRANGEQPHPSLFSDTLLWPRSSSVHRPPQRLGIDHRMRSIETLWPPRFDFTTNFDIWESKGKDLRMVSLSYISTPSYLI